MIAQPNWDRAKTLFHRALELNASDRAVLLEVECASDEALRCEVARLLDHHNSDDSFMRCPAPHALGPGTGCLTAGAMGQALDGALDTPTEPGTMGERRFGRYRLLEEIGRGGMGVVYRAIQDKPRREVAVKILPPTLATPRMMRRFELEADLLGRLAHRGIARIYDAGTVAGSLGPQAYFAMELIEGQPIDAAAQALTVRERLELIARACDAVHHAHQHGVIHRDLKPANILVDGTGHPVVLDFGVARAIDEHPAGATLTHGCGLVGTLAYMSPEQLDGKADTRSDVYALGLIAHKILTGSRPYRVDNQPIDRAMCTIRSKVPQRIGAHNRSLRGDVETIVAHAIDKDPASRYDSPGAMARDIRRALAHQPITARKATSLYQLSRVARRHRVLASVAAAALTAMAAWTIVSLVAIANQSPLVVRQAALAEYHARAMQSASMGLETMLKEASDDTLRGTVDPFIALSTDHHQLDRFAAQCMARGMIPQAAKLYRAAMKHADARFGITSCHTTRAIQVYAEALMADRQLQPAADLLSAALGDDAIGYAFQPRIDETGVPSVVHSTTLRLGWTLAEVHHRQGQTARAEREYRVVLADQFRMFRDHSDWLDTLDNLVWLLVSEDRTDEASRIVYRYLDDERFEPSDEQQETIDTRILPRLAPRQQPADQPDTPVYYSLAADGYATGLR